MLLYTRYTNYKYILVATDDTTKWVEARALWTNNAAITTIFLYENIIIRCSYSLELVSGQGSHFNKEAIKDLTNFFWIIHRTSTTYYPQGNGQAESTNKSNWDHVHQMKTFTYSAFCILYYLQSNHSMFTLLTNQFMGYSHCYPLSM